MKLSVQEAAVRVLGAAISVLLVSCSTATSSRPETAAVAAGPARSYIVEAHSTDAAASAVTNAGGKVDSRLNIIDAVEAQLTDAQHARVLAAADVKQVTPNAQITTQAAASVRDNFETGSFANNDGTHRWYGDWVEQNDDNNPHGGKVTIGWSDRGGRRLIVSSNGAIYRRAATPANSATVTLKFKYARAGLDFGDYVSVQASGNGGTTWTELGRLNGPANDMSFINQSYNITSYRGRDTAIRFVGSMGGTFRPGQRRHRRCRDHLYHHLQRRRPVPGRRERARPAHRRHQGRRHRRRGHRHGLLEARLARQGLPGQWPRRCAVRCRAQRARHHSIRRCPPIPTATARMSPA